MPSPEPLTPQTIDGAAPDPRVAELKAALAERDAEIARLREDKTRIMQMSDRLEQLSHTRVIELEQEVDELQAERDQIAKHPALALRDMPLPAAVADALASRDSAIEQLWSERDTLTAERIPVEVCTECGQRTKILIDGGQMASCVTCEHTSAAQADERLTELEAANERLRANDAACRLMATAEARAALLVEVRQIVEAAGDAEQRWHRPWLDGSKLLAKLDALAAPSADREPTEKDGR